MMLSLEHLRPSQYRQVAEWEYGPQREDTDWDRYEAEMNAPQWRHFGIYSGEVFLGCLSLEIQDPSGADFHVVTARRAVKSQELTALLLSVADCLFQSGFLALTAHIPRKKRAAIILALRCGMFEYGHTSSDRRFILTRSRFQ